MITLLQMENTVRRMTARYTSAQMQTSQIDTYINNFMTLFLPLHFKNIKLTKPYVFTTIPNVDTYDFVYEAGLLPNNPDGTQVPGNVQITPPVYCQGYILRYYQDKTTFYNRWPKLSVNQQVGTANGTAGPYTGTITPTPFLRAQVDIFGNVTESAVVISVQDNSGFTYVLNDQPVKNSNIGNLIDNENNIVGNVNYLTGVFNFTSQTGNLPDGDIINASVVPYGASRPTDVIFYNQQITFRPVPFDVYQVEFQISQQPISLIGSNSFPELSEWYLFICAGAAKLIYTDFPDPEGMANLMPIWQEQLELAQRRTLRQLSTQRASTIFSNPGRPLATWFLGTEYSGTAP